MGCRCGELIAWTVSGLLMRNSSIRPKYLLIRLPLGVASVPRQMVGGATSLHPKQERRENI